MPVKLRFLFLSFLPNVYLNKLILSLAIFLEDADKNLGVQKIKAMQKKVFDISDTQAAFFTSHLIISD